MRRLFSLTGWVTSTFFLTKLPADPSFQVWILKRLMFIPYKLNPIRSL
jgi:hypothetical protein